MTLDEQQYIIAFECGGHHYYLSFRDDQRDEAIDALLEWACTKDIPFNFEAVQAVWAHFECGRAKLYESRLKRLLSKSRRKRKR